MGLTHGLDGHRNLDVPRQVFDLLGKLLNFALFGELLPLPFQGIVGFVQSCNHRFEGHLFLFV